MARVNISLPMPWAAALAEELDRRSSIALLDRYLNELDEALGPVSPNEPAAAAAWAERELGAPTGQVSGASSTDT